LPVQTKTTKMYNPNMVVDILAIPPRKDPGDVCCKLRFSMRTEDDPAYVPGIAGSIPFRPHHARIGLGFPASSVPVGR
jgi:hypothetical protein